MLENLKLKYTQRRLNRLNKDKNKENFIKRGEGIYAHKDYDRLMDKRSKLQTKIDTRARNKALLKAKNK